MDKRLERILLDMLLAQKLTLATAESCTGGWLGKRITDLAGSSSAYLGGVISYSDEVKHRLLGVPEQMLRTFGAVSEPVARAMAEGIRRTIGSDIGVGITGIAGPGSDDTNKPVGLVYIAVSNGADTWAKEFHFVGDRAAVRQQSCDAALALLQEFV